MNTIRAMDNELPNIYGKISVAEISVYRCKDKERQELEEFLDISLQENELCVPVKFYSDESQDWSILGVLIENSGEPKTFYGFPKKFPLCEMKSWEEGSQVSFMFFDKKNSNRICGMVHLRPAQLHNISFSLQPVKFEEVIKLSVERKKKQYVDKIEHLDHITEELEW